MIRRIANTICYLYIANAVVVAVDWMWFHGLGRVFGFMEHVAGFWALAVVCVHIYVILIVTWKLTKWEWIYRGLMRISQLMPCYLFVAYLCRNLSVDPKRIHSFESFYAWQTATLLRSQEIHAARALLPFTFLLVTLLSANRIIKKGTSASKIETGWDGPKKT